MRLIKALAFISGDAGMRRSIGLLAIFLTAVLILSMTDTAKAFEDAEIRIEVNSTDGDAGLQIFLDGDPWKRARVKGPSGRTVFAVNTHGKLKKLGSTELFMESNEPNFEEQSLSEILEFLPEGEYKFEGRTIDNEKLEATATLTHDLPCGPELTFPEEEEILNPDLAVFIAWDLVTNKLNNETSECDEETGIEIIGYQVIVDNEDSDPFQRFDIKLPADATTVLVPPEFIEPDTEYKFEVLALEASGNQTISERIFFTSN